MSPPHTETMRLHVLAGILLSLAAAVVGVVGAAPAAAGAAKGPKKLLGGGIRNKAVKPTPTDLIVQKLQTLAVDALR